MFILILTAFLQAFTQYCLPVLGIGFLIAALTLLTSKAKAQGTTTGGSTQAGYGVIIVNGVAMVDSSIIMCVQRAADSIASLKASMALKIALSALSISATGTVGAATYNNVSGVFTIPIYATSTPTPDTLTASRAFGTSYLMSSTKYVDICPNAKLSCNLSLTGGQEGTIILETSPDNTTWTQKGIITGSNTGSLTIGLNTTQSNGGALCTTLPPNYVWRMRTTNVTGMPTFTMQQGSKTIY